MNNIFAITTHKQPKVKLLIFSMICFIILFVTFFSLKSLAGIDNDQALKNKNQHEAKPKVIIIISSDKHGYWLPEVLEPYQLLQQAGFEIDIASPLGGKGKASGSSRLSSEQEKWFEQSNLLTKLSNSLPINQVKANDYQAIYFAGGSGPMFDFINNKVIQKLTASIYQNGGVVSADCHGIAALLNVTLENGSRLIVGKKITAKANHEEGRWARNNYPFLLEDKIIELGGHYSSKTMGKPHVVLDGRLITGQNPASAIPMAKQLIQTLLTLDSSQLLDTQN
ncbi:MAG: putative intracellular protease/amidase [Colwellia sp.]|jgi:putative intracellular protease/amidase